jgi:hypothetical protein
MPPFDMSWTPALENKLSTQIDGQLPDFIAEDHPKFSQFLKSYYQFLEAGELQLTVNIDNILLEINTATNLLNEDGTLIVTEVGSGSTGKFIDGETITGGTSYATATVLVEDLGHTTPRMFISSQQLFETGETVTGGTSGASGVVTRYRANPVQNIQQLLAYADIDNTIYDFIEEFRKSFMEGIPSNLATGINKRNLEKHIGELYRRKGTKEAAKLFMRILLDESAEVFYPNQYMMKISDADWDKPTAIRCATVGTAIADELIGQSITGQGSGATALVESSSIFSASGGISYVEFEISNIVGTFEVGETLYGISSVEDVQYDFVIKQINSDASISNNGTLYSVGDTIDLDTSIAIGSGDILAKVGEIQRGSVSGVAVDDGGTNYELGDLIVFIDNGSEAGLVQPAEAEVTVIHGNLIDETDSDTILQESGTTTFVNLFNVALEEGTIISEEPYAVYGTDTIYSNALGYNYPIYLTNYAAEDVTIVRASAAVNGATVASTTITLDSNSGTIAIGMRLKSNSISAGATVTVSTVASQTSITISSAQTFPDNEVLVFASTPTEIREYNFKEYPGTIFYSPVATTAYAQSTYSTTTYKLYGGNFNHRSDQLYGESGNAASYTGTINTEVVLGDRVEMESALITTTPDNNRYADEGFILESGDGDITKIFVTEVGEGYSLLPSLTVRSEYGASAKVLATTTDIGRVESIDVVNPGFNYSEAPSLEPRANFVIKDITGTFVVGAALTSHTGTVRSYDSTTQVVEVSLEDRVAIQSESFGTTSNEGMLLEASLTTNAYIDDNLIMDANLIYGENLVDASGDRLLLDAISATTDFVLLEDGQGELIMEHPNTEELAQTILEDGSGSLRSEPDTYGHDDDNIMGEFISQESGFRTDDAVYVYDLRQVKFVLESLPPAGVLRLTAEAGNFILLDADLEYKDDVVLNGTDATSANAGDKLVFNATDASGTSDPSNLVVLEAGLTNDANEKLLYETDDPFTNLVLDGVDSSSLHASQKVLFEDAGIDFSAGTTSLTTATASGTIVHADVAKASFTLGTTIEKEGLYGGIESLIGEELIKIQDSYYYQQFSYEIQSNAGGNSYLNELKKAIHPAGFHVFSKVVQTTLVSAAIETTGASLGTNDYDANTYSAILASTFTTLFSETMQRRLGVMDEEDYEILLETSETSTLSDVIVLNQTDSSASDAGYNIEFETPLFAFTDFDAFEIQHGTGQGDWGSLLINSTDGSSNDGDKIIPESAEAVSNNLILDSNNDSNHLLRVGGGILLDQTDSSASDAGDSIELESSICDGVLVLANERPNTVDNLLDEDNANRFVGSTTVDNTSEVFLRSSITTKLSATINKTHNTSNGLVFLATADIKSITGDTLAMEDGLSQRGSSLLITGTSDVSPEGAAALSDAGDQFLVETDVDVNLSQSVTISTFTSVANDNLVQDTAANENDNLILENPVGFHGGGALLGEDFIIDAYYNNDILLESGYNILTEDNCNLRNEDSATGSDFSRDSLVNISDDNSLDTIVLEGDELGTFKQEDETTVTGTFGDDILLEDATSFGVEDKLSLEKTLIALETSLNTGEIPFGATEITTLAPFAKPSDIFVRTIGKMSLEDYDQGDNIVFDTAVNAGDDILLEDGTELDLYSSYISSGILVELGFSSGTTTFDSSTSFDELKV